MCVDIDTLPKHLHNDTPPVGYAICWMNVFLKYIGLDVSFTI